MMRVNSMESNIDEVLKSKINELSNTKFSENIGSYFRDLSGYEKSNRYDLVERTISSLWSDSQKSTTSQIFYEMRNFEPILQQNKRYRDHFIHSFNVYLLGYYILNKIMTDQSTNPYRSRSNDPNLTWMLTSTFHDIAYPLQEIDSWINKIIKTFLGIDQHISINIGNMIPPIYNEYMQMISRENRHRLQGIHSSNLSSIDWKLYSKLNEKIIEKDHGVWSSLILAHSLLIKEGYGDTEGGIPGDFNINHLPAIHAIALHTLTEDEIIYETHPFAYLLALTDELQDWGRPTNNPDNESFYLDDINYSNSSDKINLTFKISEINHDKTEKLQKNLCRLKTRGQMKFVILNNLGNTIFSS